MRQLAFRMMTLRNQLKVDVRPTKESVDSLIEVFRAELGAVITHEKQQQPPQIQAITPDGGGKATKGKDGGGKANKARMEERAKMEAKVRRGRMEE